MKSILIIRLSSIGDIILCSPVIRATKAAYPDANIIALTKERFTSLWKDRPEISGVVTYESKDNSPLLNQKFDLVIDLHKNHRTRRLKRVLQYQNWATFNKINIKKWLAVNFKWKSILPDLHIVDRKFEELAEFGIFNDGKGLDLPLTEENKALAAEYLKQIDQYSVCVLGGTYFTKRIPKQKWKEILPELSGNIVLLGGPEEEELGDQLAKEFPNVLNLAGKLSLPISFCVLEKADIVISGDTGLMHASAALKRPIISVWGNTVPELGMTPYYGKIPVPEHRMYLELPCQPCSKLGHNKCPKGHFKCMNALDPVEFGYYQKKIRETRD